MKRITKSSDAVKVDPGETPLETYARIINEFRQAFTELATAAEQSIDPPLHAVPVDRILAHISRLAAILQDMSSDHNAANALSALGELRIDMGETVRELRRHGSFH